MDQQVVNNTKALRTLTYSKDGKPHTLPLMPGANIVDSEIAASAKEVEYQKKLFTKGLFREKAAPSGDQTAKPGQFVEDMSRVRKADALELIAKCEDVRQLQDWLMQDGRESIQKAIYARRDELSRAEAGGDNEDSLERE